MINVRIRDMFFDSEAVIAATSEGERKALSAYGATVRTAAIKSIVYRKEPSAPGQPPHAHKNEGFKRTTKTGKVITASPLKELILFAYSAESHSVIVGPTLSNYPTGAPKTLEHGGMLPSRPNHRRRLRVVGGSGEMRIVSDASMSRFRKQKINRPWLKKNKDGIWVAYGKIRNAAEAAHANRLNAELYGPTNLPPATVKPRPFMGPAAQSNFNVLPAAWRNN